MTAAYLARRGARGPLSVLEASYGGFLTTFGDGAADLAQATAGLGTDWQTLHSGFKVHAACRGVHGLLDALLDLRAEHELKPGAIAAVEVTAGPDAIRRLGKTEVVTPLQAQLSLPYAAAVALLFGTAGPEQFDAACIERDDVARMMARVRFYPAPGSSHVSAVTVETVGENASGVPSAKRGAVPRPRCPSARSSPSSSVSPGPGCPWTGPHRSSSSCRVSRTVARSIDSTSCCSRPRRNGRAFEPWLRNRRSGASRSAKSCQALPLLFGIVVLTFALIHLAPGDPLRALSGDLPANEEYVRQVRERYGLDRPLPEQFVTYVSRVVQGDLGFSLAKRQPVADVLISRMGPTALLVGTAIIGAALLGVSAGVAAAAARTRGSTTGCRSWACSVTRFPCSGWPRSC